MGAKVTVCFILLCMLCGCSRVVEQPYTYIADGVYAYGDTVWENGVARNRAATDTQALQCVTDDRGVPLSPGGLAYYTGTLYSLSNYRELLSENGYRIESGVRASDVLDTTPSSGPGRVRLIYRPSGSTRILFENLGGAVHILLGGVRQ